MLMPLEKIKMKIYKLIIKNNIKRFFNINFMKIFIPIFAIAIGLPIYGVIKPFYLQFSSSNITIDLKLKEFLSLQSMILIRFSLSIYIAVAWTFINKTFYEGKINGEVEALLGMGVSGKKLWLIKSISIIIASIILVLPLIIISNLIIYILFIKFAVFKLNIISYLFVLIINPIILSEVILLVGCFQILSDDSTKSSFFMFGLFFLTYVIPYKNNIYYDKQIQIRYLLIYGAIIIVMAILNYLMSKVITNENIVLSKFKIHKKNTRKL